MEATQKPDEEIVDISQTDIIELQKKLKKLDPNWAENLAEKMKSDEGFEDANRDLVYRITNGKNKHQLYRRCFLKHGKPMLTDLIKQQNAAINGPDLETKEAPEEISEDGLETDRS